jgi:hypothetical protein
MTDSAIAPVTVAVVIAAAVLLIVLVNKMSRARLTRTRVRRLREYTDRALMQLKSSNRDEILAGLQTIALVNDGSVRARAREDLELLAHSEDEQLASQAMATLARIASRAASV